MRIRKSTSRAFLTAMILIALAIASPARAAEEGDQKTANLQTMADGINNASQSMAQQQASLQNQLKKIIQQESQDAQNASRRKSQQTAAALAGVGAAIAGVGCVMMMKAAQEQTDQSMKMMMMSMAMQQCSQAAQSAANAAKNDDGQQQLADTGDDPTPAPLPSTTVPSTEASSTQAPSFGDSSPTPGPTSEIAGDATVAPSAFDNKPSGTPSAISSGKTVVAGTADAKSGLAPIPEAGTTYDESAKAGNSSVGSGPDNTNGLTGATLASIGSAAGNAVNDVLNKLGEVVGKHGAADGGDGGGAAGGPESSAAGGAAENADGAKDAGINSMLAGMMGPNGGPVAGGPREDVLSWRPAGAAAAANGQKPPNIFQYASYRMKKYSKEGGVSRGAKKVSRGLASVPDKAGTAKEAVNQPPAPPKETGNKAPAPPPSAQKAPLDRGKLVAVKP